MPEGGRRPAVASLVLVATVLACFWLGTYTEASSAPSIAVGVLPMMRHAPTWTIPTAFAVGLVGAALAFLIYRLRDSR